MASIWPYMVFYGILLSFLAVMDPNSFGLFLISYPKLLQKNSEYFPPSFRLSPGWRQLLQNMTMRKRKLSANRLRAETWWPWKSARAAVAENQPFGWMAVSWYTAKQNKTSKGQHTYVLNEIMTPHTLLVQQRHFWKQILKTLVAYIHPYASFGSIKVLFENIFSTICDFTLDVFFGWQCTMS